MTNTGREEPIDRSLLESRVAFGCALCKFGVSQNHAGAGGGTLVLLNNAKFRERRTEAHSGQETNRTSFNFMNETQTMIYLFI